MLILVSSCKESKFSLPGDILRLVSPKASRLVSPKHGKVFISVETSMCVCACAWVVVGKPYVVSQFMRYDCRHALFVAITQLLWVIQ